jgi:hypothetical protein
MARALVEFILNGKPDFSQRIMEESRTFGSLYQNRPATWPGLEVPWLAA